ncbi:MAG: S8 family serine peptidase [Bacteroidales bacterium]|jgi:subtilisin family serine protease|nr:S8 family serine peptidase [Bacteroidales bacterium]MCI1785708.1 S8 family serine peptidase [Bacteroidales bacterium]
MKIKFIFPLLAIFFFFACSKENQPVTPLPSESGDISDTLSYEPGVAIVKFSDDMTGLVESDLSYGKVVTKSMGLNEAVDELGIVSMTRLFPYAGEFEPRTRAEGLHKWYVVKYDKDVSVTKAGDEFSSIPGIEYVENQRKIKTQDFNDPDLSYQWHYYNDGTGGANYKAGADINVKPVWKDYTTGNPNVIVAEVDGGIDFNHPDLAANCIAGGSDGSRNFVDNNYTIVAHDHGTHVAGTIAAVNNNGIGVCGIAGGDAANNVKGVKLLSCQVFEDYADGTSKSGPTSSAIKWGADHGAVICQNSWGYSYDADGNGILDTQEKENALNATISASDKAAVDYFIKYAGCDNSGNQLSSSPMKGGVVIFAAGNDGLPNGAPGNYDPIIAVGAIGSDGKRAGYSNYGSWVDIAAPGSSVYSTLSGSKYGYMSGTSMACPHVSGVAALVVSYLGGPGFTNTMLEDRLIKGAKKGFLSSNAQIGNLVDALGAITYGNNDTPDAVSQYTAVPSSNNIDFTWKVTGNKSFIKAYGFILLASTDRAKLENVSLNNPGDGIIVKSLDTPDDAGIGDEISSRITGLSFDTQYYVAIAAHDYSMNYSALSGIKTVTTGINHPPMISIDNANLTIHAYETVEVPVKIYDPDGHSIKVNFSGGSDAASLVSPIDTVTYTFRVIGPKASAGSYSATITATDSYGSSSTQEIQYKILEDQAPVKVKDFDNILSYNVGQKYTFDVSDYITDPDGETPTITAACSNMNVVHFNQSGNILYMTTIGYGLSDVAITGSDALGKSVTSSFRILVRDSGTALEAYPNPVKDSLNIRTGETDAETRVKIISSTGSIVYDKTSSFSAFNPLKVDMTNCAPGKYSLSVVYDGKTYNKIVVKK